MKNLGGSPGAVASFFFIVKTVWWYI
jgi:hypothetical protein